MSGKTMVELREEYHALKEKYDLAKKELDAVKAEISSVLKPKVNGFGTVNREVDGVAVKITVPKQVDWNQDVLAARYADIVASGANPNDYLKVSYSIPETQYKNWPQEFKDAFSDARTEKAGTMTFKFSDEEEKDEPIA